MLDAGIVWQVVTSDGVPWLLGVTALLAWPVGRLLRRGALGVVFVTVLGVVLAATTTTFDPYFSYGGVVRYLHSWTAPWLFQGFFGTDEKLANIGLFLPLGFLATWLWRRPVIVTAGCAVLSFLIEAWQGFIGRTGDPVDVLHNAAGAALGVFVLVMWRRSGADAALEEVGGGDQAARVDHGG